MSFLNDLDTLIESRYIILEIMKKYERSCIIHQIRSSTRYTSYNDIKAVMTDLKLVYKAPTEKAASANLDRFEEKWKTKYPSCVKSWRVNWSEL
jgi:putative transposase